MQVVLYVGDSWQLDGRKVKEGRVSVILNFIFLSECVQVIDIGCGDRMILYVF